LSSVFVDTSALYALLVAEDREHEKAGAILTALDPNRSFLVTSSFVILETVALLQSRIGVPAVRGFQEAIFPVLDIVWVDARLYSRAASALLAATKRDVSLTDWSSFEVMRERGIRAAFAFDEHFAQQGFELLVAPS
jgi:predicted nucleic acid-binding protein